MPRAVILGNSGHARVIASFLACEPVFVTTEPAGEDLVLSRLLAEDPDADYYVGIGSNADRLRIAGKIRALGGRLPACVAPNVFVARDAAIGDGTVICSGSSIGSRAVIGFGCIVNTLSSVDHDCRLGDFSQVTAGVTFGGSVVVGVRSFFGVKSAVVPNLTIGDDVVVMAGALVTADLPDRVMAGGNPARIVCRL